MTIGEKIKRERLKKNLTQEYVANYIGTTKQAVYKYENSVVTNIPTDKIELLADLFGVSPSYLMGWEDEPKEHPPIPESLTEDERFWVEIYRKVPKDAQDLLLTMANTLDEQSEEARKKLAKLLEAALQMRGLI